MTARNLWRRARAPVLCRRYGTGDANDTEDPTTPRHPVVTHETSETGGGWS